MGEVVMNNNAKSSFLSATYTTKQKRQSHIISLLLLVMFLLSSFIFFYMAYSVIDVAGSVVSGSSDVAIQDLIRNMPIIISFLISFYAMMAIHALQKGVDEKRRIKSVFKDSLVTLVFSIVNIIYVLVMLIIKRYDSLIEKSPTYLFPLDTMLFSLLFVGISIVMILKIKKKEKNKSYSLPLRKIALADNKILRFFYCFGIVVWTLVSLYGLTAGIYSIFIYDFAHEYVFYGIMTILIYLLSPIYLGVWQFYFHALTEEKKAAVQLPLSLISLGISIVVTFLYFLSLSLDLDAPSNAGFGMFPIAFAASTNLGTFLIVFMPGIVSIINVITALIKKAKPKRAYRRLVNKLS